MRLYSPTALLLAALLAVTAYSQAPLPKEKDKDKDKDKGPISKGAADLKWPTEIAGRSVKAWLDDVNSPDPAIREIAVTNLPSFGPSIQKDAAKLLLARMRSEPDPGVKIAVFNAVTLIGFDNPKDEAEAIKILGNVADEGSGMSRQHAIKTLGAIGPKAEIVVSLLTGNALNDRAYETRRAIAATLGQIGINETRGPNTKALNALSVTLAKDVSATVRMEALQSLVLLGPPWDEIRKLGATGLPKYDYKGAAFVAEAMRNRLKEVKGVIVEHDKQLEIWCRVVLMRFDLKEINDTNLSAIAKYIGDKELGPKVQALQAIAIFGESAAAKVDAVAAALADTDHLVLSTALTCLAAMGVKSQGIVPQLKALEQRLAKEKKVKEEKFRQDENLKTQIKGLKPEEQEKAIEKYVAQFPEELLRQTVEKTIEFINKSKPGLPGGEQKAPEPAPKKP